MPIMKARSVPAANSDAVLHSAREAVADFLNAASPDEIVFGNNMTTITFNLARALSKRLSAGDEIVVTRLDHDANISPWLLTAEDRGCKITWVDFDVEDGTLKVDEFARAMERQPKIVAFGYASNALGTINPARKLAQMAREAGRDSVYRCRAVCAAWPDRRAATGLRFPGVFFIQVLRPTRRRPVWAAGTVE